MFLNETSSRRFNNKWINSKNAYNSIVMIMIYEYENKLEILRGKMKFDALKLKTVLSFKK